MTETATEPAVTVAQVMAWGPCYDEARIVALFAGRERLTAPDILDLGIPPRDRLWAALREELIPAPTLHEFACSCAESALDAAEGRGDAVDPRSRAAIVAKRAWLRGEIDDRALAAARDAAWEAARAAAGAAARAAAGNAARAAAGNAALAAAWEAARAAAGDAAVDRLRLMISAA